MFSKSNLYRLYSGLASVALVVFGFFLAQIVVVLVLRSLLYAGIISQTDIQSTLVQFGSAVFAYMLALAVIVGLYGLFKNSTYDLRKLLGISKKPRPTAIYYTLAGYGVYFLLSIFLLWLAQVLVPSFSINQQQAVGFDSLNGNIEYILAFIALVVLAPIFEEAIFRGFLMTRLRGKFNFITSAIIVSLVFGLVHMQWNVGIDVFALSLVLCYVREKTGSIWSGIGIHMLKNALAFFVLFSGMVN